MTTGRRAALLAGTALCAAALTLPAVAQPAPNARPTGGSVTAGNAAISASPTNTQINQSTQRAAIDWRSFNVGSQQSVTFSQPSPSAMTLNRVIGPDPSQIAGRIDANGQIVLVNQSGVTFYKGAQVNTNGLMVSAAGISNQNFMAGTMKFDQPGNPNAKIVNQGTITVRQAGLAAFVAPQVANSGVINARLGHVVLAGAKTATLDLYGDGLVSLDVTNQVTATPSGATALVTNSGVIAADGGTVQLTAAAADGIVQKLVDAGGRIRAATMGTHAGTIALNGVGGDIVVEGQLATPGIAPGTKGGAIEIATTGNVTVASTARIDAAGRAGGGTVAIGTTLARARGGPAVTPTVTARNVTIAAGATITADARNNGDGGRVTVLSTDATQMHGSISARGGTLSGNGGFVEVSGGTLALAGPIDVSAPHGTIGTILLDPDTLEIINAALGGGDQDTNLGATGTILAGDPNTTNNQVSNGEIDSLLGNIVLQAKNLLTIDAGTPITLQPDASLSLSTLNGNILIGAGSPIVASGTGSIIMQAGTAGSGATLALNSDITTGASGSIALAADAGISFNAATLTTGVLDVSTFSSGGVTQSAAGVIAAATLQSASGVAGALDLPGTANAIAALGSIAISGGALLLNDAAALTVGGPVTASAKASISGAPTIDVSGSIGAGGALTLSAGAGGIAFAAGANASAAVLDIATTGTVSETATAVINAGTLRSGIGITGSVSLIGTANAIAALEHLALSGASSSVTLIDASTLTIGVITTKNNFYVAAPAETLAGVVTAGGRLGLQTDSLTLGGGALDTVTAEIAPRTAGTAMTLGAAGGLSLANLGFITATTVRIGTITLPGSKTPTTTAGTVVVAATFGTAGTLQLDSLGGISETTGLLHAAKLTGHAAGDVLLVNANTIATLGAFTAGGTFALNNTASLSIGGLLNAGVVDLSGNAISEGVGGTINAGVLQSSFGVTGNAALGNANTIGTLAAFAATGSLSLRDASALTVSGSVSAGSTLALQAAGITFAAGALVSGSAIDLASSAGISQPASATLTTATLQSSGGVTGDVTLAGSANAIANLGSFLVSSGSLSLADATDLVVAGSVAATNIAVTTPGSLGIAAGMSAPGTIALTTNGVTVGSGGSVFGAALIDVNGGTVGIALAGTGNIGSSGSGTVDLSTIGGISEAPTATLNAALLRSRLGVTGDVTLPHAAIGAIGTFIVTAGSFALIDSVALSVPGALTATGGIALTAPSIDIGGVVSDGGSGTTSLIATTGSIGETGTLIAGTLSGSAATSAKLTGVNQVGTLGNFTAAAFTLDDSTPLVVPATLSASSIALTAPSIDIGGVVTDGGSGTTSLIATTGSIGETGTLIAGTLSGSAATSASLTATNHVGTLGNFTAVAFTLDDATPLVAAGSLSAPSIALTAPNIDIGGVVSDGGSGTTSLIATTGSIGETGTLIAGTLSGSAATSAKLTGVNHVGTLGNFTAAAFTLDDSTPLVVPATLSASSIALTAPSIDIGGVVSDGGSGTTSLIATTGSIGETGTLIAGTLSGSAAGAAGFPNVNVGTIASFTAADLTLTDASALAVTGPVSAATISFTAPAISGAGAISTPLLNADATGTISLTGANTIAALGSIAATSFTLHDTSALNLSGSVAATTVDLIVAGSIGETGTLIAGTLSGSATASAKLTGVNQVGTLGDFSAASFTLHDTTPLIVAGSLSAPSIALTAPIIDVGGVVSDGGSGTTSLIATSGSIGETGTLIAGTLSGSAATNASLIATNRVGTLGAFAAAAFTLNDGTPLILAGSLSAPTIQLTAPTINIGGVVSDGGTGTTSLIATTGSIGETGTLIVGTLSGSAAASAKLAGINQVGTLGAFTAASFTLSDTAPLIVAGPLSAPAIALTAASVTIPGTLNDGGAGTTSLIATSGTIAAPGTLTVGTLSGKSSGATTLTSAAENIGTIAGFTAANFTLDDAIALAIAGPLSAATVSLTAPAISGAGAISTPLFNADATGTISLTGANTIAALGSIIASSFTLHDTSALTLGGSVAAATVDLVVAGTIGETGTLNATTLSGSAVGAANFTGSNAITNLGGFAVTGGNLSLVDGTGLTVTGGVAANNIAITTPGKLSVAAGMFAPGGTIALTANGVTVGAGGSVFGATLIDVNGGTAGIALTGSGNIGSSGSGTVDLSTTGGISEAPTASLNAALLQSALGVTGNVSLPHTAIGAIGNFTVTAGSFALTDSLALSVLGALTATNGVALTAPSIDITGLVSDGGSTTTSLIATTGSIGETGTLIAGTLSGSAATSVSLTGVNQVGTLGGFTAAAFTLKDATPLIVTGALSAPSIALTAPSINVGGVVTDGGGGTTSLIATSGSIGEPGTLIVGTLSGSSTADTNLTGASNKIATIGSFTAANLTLTDASSLAVAGPISAATVSFTAPGISGAGAISTPLLNANAAGAISLTGANTIAALGSITATSFTLNDTSALNLSGSLGVTTANLIVAGTIGETGTLNATTLSGSAVGLADFAGTNAITNLGSFTVSGGSLLLLDPSTLHVTGPVTASGSIYLASSNAAGIAIASGGTLASPLTSVQADAFSNSGVVSATTFELAPFHSGTAMPVPPTAGITATNVRFGAVTVPGSGLTTTAGSIIIGANFGTPTMAIELDSQGDITETTGALTAAILTGRAPGNAVLGNTNSIATLDSFTAGGTFLLKDASPLSIAATLNAPLADLSAASITETKGGGTIIATTLQSSSGVTGNVALTNTNTIATLGGFITGGAFTLNDASALTINGPLSATLVDLTAASLTEPASAVISAGTLQSTGGVSGNVSLAGTANAISTLGAFIVTGGGFALTDATALTVAGSGVAANDIAITTSGKLSVAAGMFAPGGTIALTANGVTVGAGGSVFGAAVIDVNGGTGGIALTGTGNIGSSGPGTVDLSTTGGIAEASTATLNAGLLQSALGVTGDVSLPHAAIGAIGNFTITSGSFSLTDSLALSVPGALTATKSVAITAPSIDIPGLVSDGGSGTTSLIATTGSISETGSLIAGTLSGSAVTSADLIGTNQIGTLGNFTAASFTLDDTAPLLVAGTLSAPVIALTAASIDIPGKVTDGGAGSTSLIATTGTIAETGTLIAGTLSGSSAGSTDFAAASIGTIAGFTATSFDLLDSSSLTVNGLSANVVNLTAPSISIPGALTGTTSIDLVATSGGIGESGGITTPLLTGSAAGSADLVGSNAISVLGNFSASELSLNDGVNLSIPGTLSGGTGITITDLGTLDIGSFPIAVITASAIALKAASISAGQDLIDAGAGPVSLIATSGSIELLGSLTAGTLSGSAVTLADIRGGTPVDNRFGKLGDFSAAKINLVDQIDLTVTGTVSATVFAQINGFGSLTVSGVVSAPAIGLAAQGALAIPGVVTDGGSGFVSLGSDGPLIETGTLVAGTLFAVGGASFSTTLLGATPFTNQIGTLSSLGGGGNTYTVYDGRDLVIAGPYSATTNLTIVDQGMLTIATGGGVSGEVVSLTAMGAINSTGSMFAVTLTGSAGGPVALSGSNTVINLADFTAPSFALNNATALTIAGVLNAGASAQLTAAGPITEPGTIIAGTLSGSAAGPASFTGTNQIAALGPFSATDLTLIDTQSLAVTGNIAASNVALTIAGNLTGSAALATNTLTGSASGSVALTGGNTIATLNSFSAGGSFVLNNASNLAIASTLTAPKIVINVATQLTLGDGATIVTGGSAKPSPNVTNLPNASSAPQGAFLSAASFLQLGSSTVTGISSANIVRIDTSGAGKLAFDPSAGLNAPDTWLIVGVGSGQASGNVNVAALDVTYGSVAGGSSLTGIVGGISGVTAAGAVGIQPAANPNYRFNSCVIHSVNCVLLPTAIIPTANPLNALDIGALSNSQDQEDLLLPVVSDQDY